MKWAVIGGALAIAAALALWQARPAATRPAAPPSAERETASAPVAYATWHTAPSAATGPYQPPLRTDRISDGNQRQMVPVVGMAPVEAEKLAATWRQHPPSPEARERLRRATRAWKLSHRQGPRPHPRDFHDR